MVRVRKLYRPDPTLCNIFSGKICSLKGLLAHVMSFYPLECVEALDQRLSCRRKGSSSPSYACANEVFMQIFAALHSRILILRAAGASA